MIKYIKLIINIFVIYQVAAQKLEDRTLILHDNNEREVPVALHPSTINFEFPIGTERYYFFFIIKYFYYK